MIKISQEDVLKLAKIANISCSEAELPKLMARLEAVLSYASRLKDIAGQVESVPELKNINVMRPDEVIPTPAEPLLALAPHREEQFFVVPKIIKE
jgi:aspartyl/glutamyl-tRNA(Asn/Gln) amidotransferase C subunit